MAKISRIHWEALKWMFRCLKCSLKDGLKYIKSAKEEYNL